MENPRQKKPSTTPDDPSLRVVLAEPARRALGQRERTEIAEQLGNTSPSTISRIIAALTFPTRLRSYRLARKIDRPLREVVAGHHPRYHQSTTRWGARVLFERRYRRQVFNFLLSFSDFLNRHVHFDFPTDLARQERIVIRPQREAHEYVFFQLELPPPGDGPDQLDFILSYQIVNLPPMLFDFACIEVSGKRVRAYEYWLRRYHDHELPDGCRTIWVKTWNAGKRNEYIIRSAYPFAVHKAVTTTTTDGIEVPAMLVESQLPPTAPAPMIFLPASGIHAGAPWTRTISAIEGDAEPPVNSKA